MQLPDKIVLPFAEDGDRNLIPVSSQIGVMDGAPSYSDGWPPLTMIPVEEGGIPPAGPDFNGILHALSSIARWSVAGGTYTYDSDFATNPNTGGYPAGAVLLDNAGMSSYISAVDNNTTDFNATPSSIGTLWLPYAGAAFATKEFVQAAVSAGALSLTQLYFFGQL